MGPILVQAGYSVLFTDIDKGLINAIHHHGHYNVHYNVHALDNKEVARPSEDILL